VINRLVFDLDQYGNEIHLKVLEKLASALTQVAMTENVNVLSVTTETIQEVLDRAQVS